MTTSRTQDAAARSRGLAAMVGRVPAEEFANAQRLVEIRARTWYMRNRGRCPNGWDIDDAQAEARYGLYVAAERFDPARGYRFNTIAVHYAHGYMLQALRRFAEVPGRCKSAGIWARDDMPLALDHLAPSGRQRLWETLVHDGQSAADYVDTAPLWDAVSELDPRLADVVRWYYDCGLAWTDIAARLNVSRQRVHQLQRQALTLLRARCLELQAQGVEL